MDFLKKHYEKVVLGVVLLGLVVATASLPFIKASQDAALEAATERKIALKVKPLTNLDLSLGEATIKRLETPLILDLTAPNKLFNPMPWQKAADGRLLKVNSTNIGPLALVVLTNNPLYLKITLDQIIPSDTGVRYAIGVQQEASPKKELRDKHQHFGTVGLKTPVFTLREVQGPSENPTNLVLQLAETAELINVSKDKPFKRVEGYTVSLKYPPENKPPWNDRRVGSSLSFNNEDYNIASITDSEVILSAKSNGKKWTIKYSLARLSS